MEKAIAKDSLTEGTGLFASHNIKKGEPIITFKGPTITADEANHLYIEGFDYMLQVEKNKFILLTDSIARFVNHSCEPNSFFLEAGTLFAARDIKKGEEITFDYSLNEDTPFQMNCLCGAKTCRKSIGPYRGLSVDFKKKNLDRTTPYLK